MYNVWERYIKITGLDASLFLFSLSLHICIQSFNCWSYRTHIPIHNKEFSNHLFIYHYTIPLSFCLPLLRVSYSSYPSFLVLNLSTTTPLLSFFITLRSHPFFCILYSIYLLIPFVLHLALLHQLQAIIPNSAHNTVSNPFAHPHSETTFWTTANRPHHHTLLSP